VATRESRHFFLAFAWSFRKKCLSFTYGEDKLHLGNTKKNKFSFGISLDLHYLCRRKTAIKT